MNSDHNGSSFVEHTQCNTCSSSDANSLYSDGHQYCFSCNAYVAGEGGPTTIQPKKVPLDLIQGTVQGIRKRKLTDDTCKHFNYQVGEYKDKMCQIAPYYDADGQLVAQKIRFADKSFKVLGSLDTALPFGAQAWPKTGRKIVVTEGEIDAMSMSQAQGNKWPVVSIASGAGGQVRKYIAKQRDYFLGFDEVVLMFDSDQPGREAAKIAAEILGTRAKIAELPLKDASDMLCEGRADELITAMWGAKPYRPDGIVALEDLKDRAKDKPRMGLSWPWEGLTNLTYGIQRPYIYAIGAAVGAGKTDVMRELIVHLSVEHGVSVGAFLLEEEPHVTAVGLVSKVENRMLHTPEGWDESVFEQGWAKIMGRGKVRLYDNFGINEWDSIREKIEYLYHAEGIEYFVLDHLTALIANAEDERRELDRIMAEMSGLCTRLGITLFVISHLTTPDGKAHEEGGRVAIKHMTGSRAIARWAFGAFGLERDQQHADESLRHTTTVRILKMRGFGWLVGECMWLRFLKDTGRLVETPKPVEGSSHGFKDETPNAAPDGGRSDF